MPVPYLRYCLNHLHYINIPAIRIYLKYKHGKEQSELIIFNTDKHKIPPENKSNICVRVICVIV